MQAAGSASLLEFVVNGKRVEVSGCRPQTTLLEFLRAQGLTGAKEGCAEGECGACTVVLLKPCGAGSRYTPVNSCLLFLPMLHGQEILTVEGLANGGALEPAQKAIAEAGGSQCGYCTPGFVMSLFAEHYRPGRAGACNPHALSGNLCRCTGYRPLHDAAVGLGDIPSGPLRDRLRHSAPQIGAVDYESRGAMFSRPASIEACLRMLTERPDARLIAGGTDLAVDSNLRDRSFPDLISVEAIPELSRFREFEEEVEIGVGLTLSELGERWASAPSAVQEWLELFASPLIRNRATLGGSFGTASPVGDAAPLFLALHASVRIAGPEGMRTQALDEFFQGYRQTSLRRGELLVSVLLPKPLPAYVRFYKVAKRRMDDISTIAAGFSLDLKAGRVSRAVFAYGGVAATPIRIAAAENATIGERWNEAVASRAEQAVMETVQPIGDHRGSAAYRHAVAGRLVRKFWMSAGGGVA